MQDGIDAQAASCSCSSTSTAGVSDRCHLSGRPTAESVEEVPAPPLQLGARSFDSNKAQRGSVELQDMHSLGHRDLRAQWQVGPAPSDHAGHTVGRFTVPQANDSADSAAAAAAVNRRVEFSNGTSTARAVENGYSTEPAASVQQSSSSSSDISHSKDRHRTGLSTHKAPATVASRSPHLAAGSVLAPLQTSAAIAAPSAAAAAAVSPLPAAAVTHDTLWPYIQLYGRGIMSISTLQEGLQYHVLPGVGYMAYAMMKHGPEVMNILVPVVLGDPLCHPSNYRLIAAGFLKKHPGAMFLQISKSFAFVLRGLGLLINSVGGETQLDLEKYTFSGYAKRGLRSAITSAVKEGITVHEVMNSSSSNQLPSPTVTAAANRSKVSATDDWSEVASEMMEVDKRWLRNKGRHADRVWFVNRPPVFSPECGVRKFIARDCTGQMLAYVFFDAVYDGGVVAGYYANVTRMRPDAHPGVLNLIIKEFIDRIRSESQLAAPTKNISMKKSQRKKQQQQRQRQQAPATAAVPMQSAGSITSQSSSSSSTGPRFLSLGLSPLHQMIDGDPFSYSRFVKRLFEFSFKQGSGYYPFDSLAAAKAKYGAGLHHGVYEDPNVTYKQVYLAHTARNVACMAMFDLGKMLGFWKSPADAAMAFSGHKIKDGMKIMKHRIKHMHASRSSSGRLSPSSSGSNSETGKDVTSSSSTSSTSSSSTWSAAAPAAAIVHTTAGPDSADADSCDSGDENWKSGCFLFSPGRRKQYYLHSIRPSAAATAAAAAAGVGHSEDCGAAAIPADDKKTSSHSGKKCSSRKCSSKKCRLCACKKGGELLPVVRPGTPELAPCAAAAAAAAGRK